MDNHTLISQTLRRANPAMATKDRVDDLTRELTSQTEALAAAIMESHSELEDPSAQAGRETMAVAIARDDTLREMSQDWTAWREDPDQMAAFWLQRTLPEPARLYFEDPVLLNHFLDDTMWRIPNGVIDEDSPEAEEIWDEAEIADQIETNNAAMKDHVWDLTMVVENRIAEEIESGLETEKELEYQGPLSKDPRTRMISLDDMIQMWESRRWMDNYEEENLITKTKWLRELRRSAEITLNGNVQPPLARMQLWELEALTTLPPSTETVWQKYHPTPTQIGQIRAEIAVRTGTPTI